MGSPKTYQVIQTDQATEDLEIIYEHFLGREGHTRADYVASQIISHFSSLSHLPFRCSVIDKIQKNIRGLHTERHTVFYKVVDDVVYILRIRDQKQDNQNVLWDNIDSNG